MLSCQSSFHQVKPNHSAVRGGWPFRVQSVKVHLSSASLARMSVCRDVQPAGLRASRLAHNRPLFLPVYWDAKSSISDLADGDMSPNSSDLSTSFGSAMNVYGIAPFL